MSKSIPTEKAFNLMWKHYKEFKCSNIITQPSIPFLYFGNCEKYLKSKLRIISVSTSPSMEMLGIDKTNLPQLNEYLDIFSNKSLKADKKIKYKELLNSFFYYDINASWFNKSFEHILNGLNSSYYENKDYINTAIHINFITPLATESNLNEIEINEQELKASGSEIFNQLVKDFKPNLVLISMPQRFMNEIEATQKEVFAEIPYNDENGTEGLCSVIRYEKFFTVNSKTQIIFFDTHSNPFDKITDKVKYKLGQNIFELLNKHFVQFFHPSIEHIVTIPKNSTYNSIINKDIIKDLGCYEMPWNDGNHGRKFIKTSCRYIENTYSEVKNGNIMFWGEWEPQSIVEIIKYEPGKGEPKYIHSPIIKKMENVDKLQNTDPYVFGQSFYYSCCQQLRRYRNVHKKTKMQNLSRGSIILFGSNANKNDFILDTLFVVKDSINYSADNYEDLEKLVSKTFYEAVIKMVIKGNQEQLSSESDDTVSNENDLDDSIIYNKEFTLYSSVTYEERMNYNDIFSFFPCLTYDLNKGFTRPIITFSDDEIKEFGIKFSDKKNTGVGGVTEILSDKMLKKLWNKVVEQVVAQRLCLGIYAQEPEFIE